MKLLWHCLCPVKQEDNDKHPKSPTAKQVRFENELVKSNSNLELTIEQTSSCSSFDTYVLQNYVSGRFLGRGSQAEVRLCRNQDGNLFAMKVIKRARKIQRNSSAKSHFGENLLKEIEIMKSLDHPNITRLYEVVDSSEYQRMFLIMEYCERGSVISEILNQKGPMNESKAKDYFRQMLKGIEHLHFNDIIHRDIKPSNILITKAGILKLTDFGVSILLEHPVQSGTHYAASLCEHFEQHYQTEYTLFSKEINLEKLKLEENRYKAGQLYPPTPKIVTDKVTGTSNNDIVTLLAGTLSFLPPEAVSPTSESYNGKIADIWAAAVSLYIFVYDKTPFKGNSRAEIVNNILHSDPNFEIPDAFQNLSMSLKTLLKKMLTKNIENRTLSLTDIKADEWVSDGWERDVATPTIS